MRKQIDIPDSLIAALKKAAKKDYRSVKPWMEHVIIQKIKETPGWTKKSGVIKIDNVIGELRDKASDLLDDLRSFARTEKEIGDYNKTVYGKLFDMTLNSLSKQINLITRTQKKKGNRYTKVERSDSEHSKNRLKAN